MTRRRLAGVAIVVVAVLGYPLVVLAGGPPRFPSACFPPATHAGTIDLVLGSYDTIGDAAAPLSQAKTIGFAAAQTQVDECGRVDVVEPGYTDLAGSRSAVQEAKGAGFPNATLEQIK